MSTSLLRISPLINSMNADRSGFQLYQGKSDLAVAASLSFSLYVTLIII